MNTEEEENKPDTTTEDNTPETPKDQGANVQSEPHDVLVETVTPGSHKQETDAVKEPKEDTSESGPSPSEDTDEENRTEASEDNKPETSNKPDDVHVETVTPDDGGEAPEEDEGTDTNAAKENTEEPSGERGNGKAVADQAATDQQENTKAGSANIDIPTVTPGDSADPGIEVEDDASKEHPFHNAAETEKNGDGTAPTDNKENEDDADESSNKDAGPKGENL